MPKWNKELNSHKGMGMIEITYKDNLLKDEVSDRFGADFEQVVKRTLARYNLNNILVCVCILGKKRRKGLLFRYGFTCGIPEIRLSPLHSRREIILTLLHEICHWAECPSCGYGRLTEKQIEAKAQQLYYRGLYG